MAGQMHPRPIISESLKSLYDWIPHLVRAVSKERSNPPCSRFASKKKGIHFIHSKIINNSRSTAGWQQNVFLESLK